MKDWRFHQMLRARGMTVTRLADLAGVCRQNVGAALEFRAGQGSVIRRRVARHLTERERAHLGMDADGRRLVPDFKVPHGT